MLANCHADLDAMLNRWQEAGVLDAEAAHRIRAFELDLKRPPVCAGSASLRWFRSHLAGLRRGALRLGSLGRYGTRSPLCFGPSHGCRLPPGRGVDARALSWAFNRAARRGNGFHGPRPLRSWARSSIFKSTGRPRFSSGLSALAGWILLQDEAQQISRPASVPGVDSFGVSFAAERHIGESVYVGRFLIVWAALYLTFFLGSRRKVVQVSSLPPRRLLLW